MTSLLMARLHTASDAVIRSVLTALCEGDPETEKRALRCLEALTPSATAVRSKRKAGEEWPELRLCKNCGATFLDDGGDGATGCRSHTGTYAPKRTVLFQARPFSPPLLYRSPRAE